MSAVPQSLDGWQSSFLQVLPAVETHARIQFRRLPLEQREDAVQEAIASACVSFQVLAANGKLTVAHPSTLATYAVKFVRNHRHVGGHQDGPRDVMSPVCQRRHGVKVVSYDRHQVPASLRDGSDGWKRVAVADRNANIPDVIAFALDFGRWLQILSHRDRSIIQALTSGDTTKAVADQFGLSEGRVSQLRRKFEQLWRVFQGEAGEAAA